MSALAADYIPVTEVAKECRKSQSTILRWAKERGFAIVYFGRTPWLHASEFREAMRLKS